MRIAVRLAVGDRLQQLAGGLLNRLFQLGPRQRIGHDEIEILVHGRKVAQLLLLGHERGGVDEQVKIHFRHGGVVLQPERLESRFGDLSQPAPGTVGPSHSRPEGRAWT